MFVSFLCYYKNDNSFLLFHYLYLRPMRQVTPVIYSTQIIALDFSDADFYVPRSGYHCENQLVLRSALLKKVYNPFQYSIWDFVKFHNG